MDKFTELREKHKKFVYNSYEIHKDGFSFDFSIDDYHFYPSWNFDEKYLSGEYDRDFVKYIVFNIGMIELVSYWKCACCPTVEVNCGYLDDEQIQWFKKLYYNGLGEFFYRNEIQTDIDSFMNIVPKFRKTARFSESVQFSGSGSLIAVGGGKDSVVSMELLSEYKKDNLCYMINPRGATLNCAAVGGYREEQVVGVHRTIDKTLLELNAKGYLNGHTPFSSIVAFSSYLFAYLTGKKYIVLSNESSANEANVNGTDVNHQYSKSTEFERDFREYTQKYLLSEPDYFSLLRPWSEWQIAKKFVEYPQYLSVFRSCNAGSKNDIWCGKCAKCLYVYIMLSAFLDDEQLIRIFGSDMLDNPEFEDMFNGLVYSNYDKPFECVGTRDEINLALVRSYEKRKDENPPYLLIKFMERFDGNFIELDDFLDDDNFVPEEFIGLLK